MKIGALRHTIKRATFRWTTRAAICRGLGIVTVAVVICVPVLEHGFSGDLFDSRYHLGWYACFSKQLQQGDLYPRWLTDINSGLGGPTFYFYPPLAYFITTAIDFAGFRIFTTDTLLALSILIATMLSGFSMYYWLREELSAEGSLFSAILYMASPYRVGVDIYYRGAFAEIWAFVWLPLALRAVSRIRTNPWRETVMLAFAYCALVCTHPPSALIFTPLLLIFGASRNRIAGLCYCSTGIALGLALSAGYWLSAFSLQDSVSMEKLTQLHNVYEDNFVTMFGNRAYAADTTRFKRYIAAEEVLAVIMSWLAIGSTLLYRHWGDDDTNDLFWFCALLWAFFMSTFESQLVWRCLPVLQVIQFPWRFGIVISVASAYVIGNTIGRVALSGDHVVRGSLPVIVVMLMGFVAMDEVPAGRFLRSVATRDQEHINRIPNAPEYTSRWAPQSYNSAVQILDQSPLLSRTGKSFHGFHVTVTDASKNMKVIKSPCQILLETWRPRKIVLACQSESQVLVEVSCFFFPGWRGTLDHHWIWTAPSPKRGLLSFSLPAGRHEVELTLVPSYSEKAGYMISAITGLFLLAVHVPYLLFRRTAFFRR